MAYAKVNGVELWYEEFGTGDKIVLTASGGDFKRPDPAEWPYYLADHGYHVYAITLRGHWKSTQVKEDYGMEWYNIWADDIYEFGRMLGVDKYFYTGVSHGSGVGWHLADRHPEVIKGFIAIVCGPHFLEGDLNELQTSPARERVIQLADLTLEERIKEIDKMEPDWSKVDSDELESAKKGWALRRQDLIEMSSDELRIRPRIAFAWIETEEELVEKLKTINVPTLMIAGVQDNIIDPRAMFRSACAVPGAKTIFYQSGSHSVVREYRESVKNDMLQFMREIEEKELMEKA